MFFVSYASSTGDRGPVQQFHSDVQKEIHSILGKGPGTDGRLKPAVPSPEPDPAVLDCRSMIALYSPDYLRDSQCGREWSVFAERMNRQTRKTGRPPASLVGVLWRPEGLVLPRIVADTGHVLDDVGQGYRGMGALGLMRDAEGWNSYRVIVRRIAQRVALAATTPLSPMDRADSRSVPSRFGPGRDRARRAALLYSGPPGIGHTPPERRRENAAAAASAAPSPESRRVIVVLVTGDRTRMEELRRSVSAYGDTAQDWRPFRPQDDEPVVSIIRRALRTYGIDVVPVLPSAAGHAAPPAADAADRGGPATAEPALAEPAPAAGLASAPGTDQPAVVVLVDPWMAGDPAFPTLWTRLQQQTASVAAIIVVLARGDEETRANSARLRHALARTAAMDMDAPHHEAGSAESLTHTVIGALADAWLAPGSALTARPAAESPLERFSRLQRERAAWTGGHMGPWSSLTGRPATGATPRSEPSPPGHPLSFLSPRDRRSGR